MKEKIYKEAAKVMAMIKVNRNRQFDTIQLYSWAISSICRTPVIQGPFPLNPRNQDGKGKYWDSKGTKVAMTFFQSGPLLPPCPLPSLA